MKLHFNVAGSLALATLNLVVCGVALLLVHTGASTWWGEVIVWSISPPLVLFAAIYLVVDFMNPEMRRQALVAILLILPAAVFDWFFKFSGI